MPGKSLIATLVLPLIVAASLGNAEPTITDKVYWPNELLPNANNPVETDAYSARTMETRALPRESEPEAKRNQPCYTYQGTPKSGITR